MKKQFLLVMILILCLNVFSKSFYEICANGNANELIKAIKNGVNINQDFGEGTTPIMIAATTNKNPEVLKILIKNGANIFAEDIYSNSPLFFAAQYNKNIEIIKTIVSYNLDINKTNSDGYTPLDMTVLYNEPEIVRYLLSEGANPNIRNYWLYPVFLNSIVYMSSANKNISESIMLLLNANVKINMHLLVDAKPSEFLLSMNKNNKIKNKIEELNKKDIYGFKNISFTMNENEVVALENKKYDKTNFDTFTQLEYKNIDYSDYKWNTKYIFNNNKLFMIMMELNNTSENPENLLKLYYMIEKNIEKEYGVPIKENIMWKDKNLMLTASLKEGLIKGYVEIENNLSYKNCYYRLSIKNADNKIKINLFIEEIK